MFLPKLGETERRELAEGSKARERFRRVPLLPWTGPETVCQLGTSSAEADAVPGKTAVEVTATPGERSDPP
jgi:hypothetical protein